MQTKLTLSIAAVCSFALAGGCDRAVTQREYQEVFLQPEVKEAAMQHAGHAHRGAMPDDDIHAGLMPQSSGAMPDDDIHANLVPQGSGGMPDDDIHAKLLQPGSGAMGMAGMPMSPELERSVDKSPLLWQTPEGWTEQAGGGMRLVTFRGGDGQFPVETTIISLGGSAGGLEANVMRWMRQIGLQVPTPERLEQFLDNQEHFATPAGFDSVLIDFTPLQAQDAAQTPSMIAAILDKGNAQTFVKMTGSKAAVIENVASFRALVQSIKPGDAE